MDTPPSSAVVAGEREGLAGHGPLLCVYVAKVLHGQGWREHVPYLRAGCHPCLVISNILK